MKVNVHFVLLLFLCGAAPWLHAQIDYNDADWGVHPMDYNSVGTSGWQFLKLPTNARTAAIGGINSSLSHGDATACFTNPASIADVKRMDLAFTHMSYVADIKFQSFAMVKNFNQWGSLGLNFVYLDYGEMIRTENVINLDALGSESGVSPVFNGLGTFSANDMAVGLSYARQITNKLQVGGTLRYIQEKLDDAITHGWSLDIGTLYYTGLKSLRISMLGKSFGADAEFAEYRDRIEINPIKIKMPMMFIVGAAIDVIEARDENDSRLILAAELTHPNDGPEKVNVGMEYSFLGHFNFRAGYRFNYDAEGLTLGCGLEQAVSGMTVNINYAYLDAGLLSQIHMFTIGMNL